jgi:hypothetical protein
MSFANPRLHALEWRPVPALMSAAAGGFWGWQIGGSAIGVAVLIALILELPRAITLRVDIPPARLARMFDLSLMLGFIVVGVLALSQPVSLAVTTAADGAQDVQSLSTCRTVRKAPGQFSPTQTFRCLQSRLR